MDKPSYFFDRSLVFRQIPLFAGLNPFEKRLVFDSLEVVEFRRSEIIYRCGDPPDAFYCIISGRVEIFADRGGRQETLEYIHRGKYFGFLSLLTGEPHSVSARAVNDTVLAKIPQEQFKVLLKGIPRLAIELSQMLSRRLKRKDYHDKTIFESTIVSVFAERGLAPQVANYVVNLAVGLKRQTEKKVILVDPAARNSPVRRMLGLSEDLFMPESDRFLSTLELSKYVAGTSAGIDVLSLQLLDGRPGSADFVMSALTALVNDYHFCLIPLVAEGGWDCFKVLTQSDAVHFLAAADPEAVRRLSELLRQGGVGADSEIRKKTRLLIVEDPGVHGRGPKLTQEEERGGLPWPIYATLPPIKPGTLFFVDEAFKDEYSRAIRRIVRQMGEMLVGLALGSGAAMGLAHIGVLQVLEEKNIPVDIVAGSSIGALLAALWCLGYSAAEVEKIVSENKRTRFLFGLDDMVFPLHGLIKGRHVRRFLRKHLQHKTFCDLKRPLKIVASDCLSMKRVVFDSGSLLDAVMASISIPGIFEPYRILDRCFVDGGILDPLPADVLAEAGAKKIISVNVLPGPEEIERTYELLREKERLSKPKIFDVIVSSVQSMEYLLAQMGTLSCSDITLHPDMTAVSWSAFDRVEDLVERGRNETLLHLQEIKDLVAQKD